MVSAVSYSVLWNVLRCTAVSCGFRTYPTNAKGSFTLDADRNTAPTDNEHDVKWQHETIRMLNVRIQGKKVKASHARYRALGPELIPVYRQSACS